MHNSQMPIFLTYIETVCVWAAFLSRPERKWDTSEKVDTAAGIVNLGSISKLLRLVLYK